MLEEDLKKLKEEIKKELLNELTTKKVIQDNAYKTVKKEFKKMFYSKGYTETREQCKIFDAISTITRLSLGYRNVQAIPTEKTEEVRHIMYKVLNIFPKK